MAFNINEFSAQVGSLGVLKPNKFDVQIIPVNNNFYDGNDPIFQVMKFRAEQVILPGVNIRLSDVNRYGIGASQKFAHNVAYQNVSMTFVEAENTLILKFFTLWMNKIFKMSGPLPQYKPGYLTGYKDSYVSTVVITNYNDYGEKNNIVLLRDAFPVSISDTQLSWSDDNSLLRLRVDFAFTEWINQGMYPVAEPAPTPPVSASPR